MTDAHEQFDYLCALAASDQISSDERERLDEHLRTCAECRRALHEYKACAERLALRSETYATSALPEGMYERFRARSVLGEGIELPSEGEQKRESRFIRLRRSTFGWWSAAAAILLLMFAVIARRPDAVHRQAAEPKLAVTQQSTSQLALQEEVRQLQEKQNEVTARLQKEEQALRTAQAGKDALSSQIAALRKEDDEARNRQLQAETDVQRLARQLEDAQADKTAAQNKSALDAAQITELKDRIATVQLELSRERRLSATLEEMRDLMENRNVRLIQLGGVNRGKQVRAFGRAFYIPGQKLVLFAYDLIDPKTLSAHSFYVWGDKPGTDQPAQALGKLTLEDQKDDRWAIRIESPDVFARINEIFITIESNKGNLEKPTGQPLLLTSLTKSNP